jgi:hypothetical protein
MHARFWVLSPLVGERQREGAPSVIPAKLISHPLPGPLPSREREKRAAREPWAKIEPNSIGQEASSPLPLYRISYSVASAAFVGIAVYLEPGSPTVARSLYTHAALVGTNWGHLNCPL